MTRLKRITVDTVADMVALTELGDGDHVETLGYHAVGDGGGNDYIYQAEGQSGAGAEDGGFVIYGAQADGWFQAADRSVANVKQFGAKGDGTTNDTAAIQAAIDALPNGGELVCPDGTYLVSSALNFGAKQNIYVHGGGTLLASATRFTPAIFNIDGASGVLIESLTFDCNQQNVTVPYSSGDYPTRYNGAVYAANTGEITIRDCTVLNIYNEGFQTYTTNGLLLMEGNLLKANAQTDNNVVSAGMRVVTHAGRCVIDSNYFNYAQPTHPQYGTGAVLAAGLSSTGGSLSITNNTALNAGRDNTGGHRELAIDLYNNVKNFVISDNALLQCNWGAIRCSDQCEFGTVSNNTITLTKFAGVNFGSDIGQIQLAGASVDSGSITVENNSLSAPDTTSTEGFGIYVVYTDYDVPASNIRIHNNTVTNIRFGIYVASSSIENLWITNNFVDSYALGIGWVLPSNASGDVANAKMHGIWICDNHVQGTNNNAIQFEPTAGDVYDQQIAVITGNNVTCNTAGISTRRLSCRIEGNTVYDSNYGLQSGNGEGTTIAGKNEFLNVALGDRLGSAAADERFVAEWQTRSETITIAEVQPGSWNYAVISWPGATSLDHLLLSIPHSLTNAGLVFWAYVNSGNSVRVVASNISDSPITPAASQTVRISRAILNSTP